MSAADAWLLAMETATATIVVAAGSVDGRVLAADAFEGRFRHSQELLPAVVRLIDGAGLRLADLAGVVVGTGPGAFTGLRVGIATAKTLAHELGRPVVGIPTSDALLAGADEPAILWLPSGPRDQLSIVPGGAPVIVTGGVQIANGVPIAVDLDGRAPVEALARGRAAVANLAAHLLRLGAARIAAGDLDDPELLLPRYASAPRGAVDGQADGRVAWLRDPR